MQNIRQSGGRVIPTRSAEARFNLLDREQFWAEDYPIHVARLDARSQHDQSCPRKSLWVLKLNRQW